MTKKTMAPATSKPTEIEPKSQSLMGGVSIVPDTRIEFTNLNEDAVGIGEFSMYVKGRKFNQDEIYKLLLKQVEFERNANTHSAQCWKWHLECAKQRLDAIRATVLQLVG